MTFTDDVSLLNNSFGTGCFGVNSFASKLRMEFLNKRVNVEFCCEAHVKRATSGRIAEVGSDFIELVNLDNRSITLIIFGDHNHGYRELDEKVIIPLAHVCSVEDPCRPCKDPLEDNYCYHPYTKQLASLRDSVGVCTPTEFGDQKLLPNSSPTYRSGRLLRRFC